MKVSGAWEINEIDRKPAARTGSDSVAGRHGDLAVASDGGAIAYISMEAGDAASVRRTGTLADAVRRGEDEAGVDKCPGTTATANRNDSLELRIAGFRSIDDCERGGGERQTGAQ